MCPAVGRRDDNDKKQETFRLKENLRKDQYKIEDAFHKIAVVDPWQN